ncbi:translation initiation factor IF-3 [Candidatus Roizmanbacteria bacterium RIFCSPHIGHO2_01_FULL_39_12b]|uniref:Translation initiation factor IF-3 n=1 Tax=Candidatus Roizmanbacteria bacterium RIFCSPHIGHO2_01_FULL_39_12b TaxID=1802030 RepID=A0A1F7GD01_9BACT|nr:MAG: translation initiation factor IF-3 [Candidatus Roizmanbacteria bacterium RIFCSPHIGHO2_01_FULL_39_12b]
MRKRTNPTFDLKRKFVINERISGLEFRVINDTGSMVGIMDRNGALSYARDNEVDLVLITPNANPPVVKAIDFNKFIYQEEKKDREAKKGQKKVGTKDVQLSLFIDEHDLERLKSRAQEFLRDGNQLRVRLPLKGRQMMRKEMAVKLIRNFIASLENVKIVNEPQFQGRVLMAIVVTDKSSGTQHENKTEN